MSTCSRRERYPEPEMPRLFSSCTYFTQYEPPERLCIFCGNRVGVVIEIPVDRPAGLPPFSEGARPRREPVIGIAAGIVPARAVEAHVDDRPDIRFEDRGPELVVQTH